MADTSERSNDEDCARTSDEPTLHVDMGNDATEYYTKKWRAEQMEMRESLIIRDEFDWTLDGDGENALRLVGGSDISFIKGNTVDACASLVVLRYPSMEVVYEDHQMVKLELPYIPGYLAFRETPFMVDLVAKVRESRPECVPQSAQVLPEEKVILVDGNGVLHYRGFGSACQLGLLTDIPTIGVAKKLLAVDRMEEKAVRKQVAEQCMKGGDAVDLVGSSGKKYGFALKSTDDTTRPVFVSPGHRISFETALNVVRGCCKTKIPEPVRQADLGSRRFLRDNPL